MLSTIGESRPTCPHPTQCAVDRPFVGDYSHLQQAEGLRESLLGTKERDTRQDPRRQRRRHSGSSRGRHSGSGAGRRAPPSTAAPVSSSEERGGGGLITLPCDKSGEGQRSRRKNRKGGSVSDPASALEGDDEEVVWLRSGQGNEEMLQGGGEGEGSSRGVTGSSSHMMRGARPLVGMCVEAGEGAVRPSRMKQRGVAVKAAVSNLLDTHFAHSDAVRDFNEAMPVSECMGG